MEGSLKHVNDVAAQKHPKTVEKRIQYGTAGFRTKSDVLDFVMFRMGLLAVLRSKAKGGASIGVMITASHNPECDNGVKLVDPQGEMLEASWETHATDLVNETDDNISAVLRKIVKSADIADWNIPGEVIVARDTRASSPKLAEAVIDGIKAVGGSFKDYGILTTPQLHYMVCCVNTNEAYGIPSEQGYFSKLSTAFKSLVGQVSYLTNELGNYEPSLVFDGANGVGALKMFDCIPLLSQVLDVTVINDGKSGGRLNHTCGADYVKVQQRPPQGLQMTPGVRYVSVDGDADRVVYYYCDRDGTFHLLDGDKIATLVAGYLQELVVSSGLDLNLGCVQTAYANGSSTKYISDSLKLPVACVPTGVKHLHHKALDFDVGIYFEANGHGTVIFSAETTAKIRNVQDDSSFSAERQNAARRLCSLIDVINQTVGDAISDMLLVEVVLRSRGWNCRDWDKMYEDLKNRQLKVKVADRYAITTTDAERRCSLPVGLQDAIDKLVKNYPSARSFVRPSGTEDVVRIYAESETQEDADELAYEVSSKVYEMAGGVGDRPSRQ